MRDIRFSEPPKNGELLLSYWCRIGGKFDTGFLETARAAAERHGYFYDRAHVYNSLQVEFYTYVKSEVNASLGRLETIQAQLKGIG